MSQFQIGQEVILDRDVATTIAIVTKGIRGRVHSIENGWIFVRFDAPKCILAVKPREIAEVAAVHTTTAV